MKHNIEKLITLIITLFVISFLSFYAFSVIPGDYAQSKLGTEATKEQVEALREELGLDQTLLKRYKNWVFSLLKGDFGTSYQYEIPVLDILKEKVPILVSLLLMSFLWLLILTFFFGIWISLQKYRVIEGIFRIGNQMVMSTPSFLLGMVVTAILGFGFHLFIPGNYISFHEHKWDFIKSLLVPSFVLALPKSGMAITLFLNYVKLEQKKDYVRTAYSRGNSRKQVFFIHIFPNVLVPMYTFFAMSLLDFIANSIMVEKVFSIPGFGSLLISAILNRDYPIVQAMILLIGLIVIVVYEMVDWLKSNHKIIY